MTSVPRRFPLIGLILLAFGPSAFGGNYTDPSGFSFTYPEGWVPLTRAALGDVNQVVPREVKNWISRNNVDLNRVTVVLVRDGRDEFLENLNVVVDGQQIPVDDKTVKKLIGLIAQQYGAMGVKVDDVQGRVQKVGSRDTVVVEYQTRMPGVPDTLRQRQVMFPGEEDVHRYVYRQGQIVRQVPAYVRQNVGEFPGAGSGHTGVRLESSRWRLDR